MDVFWRRLCVSMISGMETTLQAIHIMAANQAVTSLGRNVVLDYRPPSNQHF